MGVEIAPGLARGAVAADHRNRPEGREALEAEIVSQQKLAAPDLVVVAKAKSVEHNAKNFRRRQRTQVFGETGGDMGVVMLDFDQRRVPLLRQPGAELARQIVAVPVHRKGDRRMLEHAV